jgi:hypothetical protein
MSGALEPDLALARARGRRWSIDGPRVETLERAAAFVGDVHCALLFPFEAVALPSLWEAIAGPDEVAFATWGVNEDRIWGWKDELPAQGLAWYGKLVRKRATLVSPALLTDLYPGDGTSDDYRHVPLEADARRVAAALAGGAMPQSILREDVGLAGKQGKARFDRAMIELQRHVLVTHAGVWEQDAGWATAMIALTASVFDVGGRHDPVAAAGKYLATALEVTAAELARAFAWSLTDAQAALAALVARGDAVETERRYEVRSGRVNGPIWAVPRDTNEVKP